MKGGLDKIVDWISYRRTKKRENKGEPAKHISHLLRPFQREWPGFITLAVILSRSASKVLI